MRRLVDIDEFAAGNQVGKTAVIKVLDRWEKQHPITEYRFQNSDYEIVVHKNGETVVKRKDGNSASG